MLNTILNFVGVSLLWLALGAGIVGVAVLAFYGYVRAALVLALVLAFGAYGEWRAHNAAQAENQRWELATLKMQAEAATKLAGETKEVLRLERALGTLREQLEKESAQRQADSAAAEKRLAAAAARNGGRLRDPNAERGGSCGGAQAQAVAGANDRAADGSDAGGLLSVQLSDLLRGKLREADEINDAFAICREDALNLRRTMNVEQPAGGSQHVPTAMEP